MEDIGILYLSDGWITKNEDEPSQYFRLRATTKHYTTEKCNQLRNFSSQIAGLESVENFVKKSKGYTVFEFTQ